MTLFASYSKSTCILIISCLLWGKFVRFSTLLYLTSIYRKLNRVLCSFSILSCRLSFLIVSGLIRQISTKFYFFSLFISFYFYWPLIVGFADQKATLSSEIMVMNFYFVFFFLVRVEVRKWLLLIHCVSSLCMWVVIFVKILSFWGVFGCVMGKTGTFKDNDPSRGQISGFTLFFVSFRFKHRFFCQISHFLSLSFSVCLSVCLPL